VPYHLFGSYRILGGAEAGGLKPLLSVQVFLNISNENGHDSPWGTIIQDEKVIAFSY
jgi:hypothetical protein